MVPAAFNTLVSCSSPEEADLQPKEDLPEADNGPVDVLQTQPLRVATFNAHNFFNDKLDSNLDNPADELVLSADEYEAKLKGVADVLAQLQADIVYLQEVENDAVLTDLIARPELKDLAYQAHAVSDGDPRGIRIGVISTIPFNKVVSHGDDVFNTDGKVVVPHGETVYSYSRDCLEVHVSVGRPVVLLGIHFKAKTDDDPAKRLAEARRTRGIADGYVGVSPVVILGDFNDTSGSEPVKAIIGSGDNAFTSAMAELPATERWTVSFTDQEIFDDQFSDPAMSALRDSSSVTVIHKDGLGTSAVSAVSDHAPVAVTYNIK